MLTVVVDPTWHLTTGEAYVHTLRLAYACLQDKGNASTDMLTAWLKLEGQYWGRRSSIVKDRNVIYMMMAAACRSD
jgi:hypothetical protein